MRQLLVFGLLAAASVTCAGCGGLFLIATLLLGAPDPSSYSGSAPYDHSNYSSSEPYFEPIHRPADRWQNENQWSGRLSSGTIDPTGQGNDVISVDGEVLNLPN